METLIIQLHTYKEVQCIYVQAAAGSSCAELEWKEGTLEREHFLSLH